MSRPGGRDRDEFGRPRSARPRDELGRPLPPGSASGLDPSEAAALAELESAEPSTLLDAAQALLDAGRPFQAHELLEAGWKRAPEAERQLWRSLAQLAVGLTHLRRGNVPGAVALFTRSAETLEGIDAAAPYDIDAPGLAQQARQLAAAQPSEQTIVLRLRRRGSAR